MTRFLLIRHGMTDAVGRSIVSWTPGVHLNEMGRRQAAELPDVLEAIPIDAIYSSPLERARETAEPLAARRGLPVHVREAFGEVHFGEFSGHSLETLAKTQAWVNYNGFRSGLRPPGGEFVVQVQARFLGELDAIRAERPGQNVVIVSHADSIKAILALFLGAPVDLFDRIGIDPASVSILDLDDAGAWIRRINWTRNL